MGAVTYSDSYAVNDDIGDYFHADISILDSKRGRIEESKKIVNLIKECQSIDSSKTIAILVRAKSHLDHIIPALEKEGINWIGNDLNLLSDRESVIDCISLTRVFINPSDKLSWLSLLHSPLCGISFKDIQYLADAKYCSCKDSHNLSNTYEPDILPLINYILTGYDSSIENFGLDRLSDDGIIRLKNFSRVINKNWSKRGRKSLRSLVEDTWIELQGFLVGNYTNIGDDRLSVQSYFNLIESLDEKRTAGSLSIDLSLLDEELKNLFADGLRDDDRKNSLTPKVEIMTIHKSKGLEFDTVIIPSLDKVTSTNARPLLIWNEYLFKDRSRGL